ncbi:hypothetical protein SMC26_18795 [Actinomadura fulvescens]|uniref:hypothetical protein n=1 Tax=Actinomadura fulvescens TaxID=46160 RepID=UPI0031D65014
MRNPARLTVILLTATPMLTLTAPAHAQNGIGDIIGSAAQGVGQGLGGIGLGGVGGTVQGAGEGAGQAINHVFGGG